MNKYLIFRTDRIGDFIFSRMITDAIKKQNPSNIIDFVCSTYNAQYIKNYFVINSEKYDYLIVLDGKRRSVFFSLFINAKYKIAVLKDWRPFLLLKFFFNKYLINSEVKSQYNNFITLANYLDLKISQKIDYYKSYNFKKKNIISNQSNFLLLHLDEKWFEGFYYNDFNYMNLNYKNFYLLINTLFKKFNKSIIITSGHVKIPILNQILNKHFKKKNNDLFESIRFRKKLVFIDNTDFQDLELIIKKSSIVVCCEGAISHVSHAMNKKTYALINGLLTAKFWTSHMQNIKLLKREPIQKICKQINNL